MKNATRKSLFASHGLPALAAVGGSIAAMPAAALELGDVTVQSRLGQPLRASIAFALAPNEQVSNTCVTLRPGASLSGLPNVANATVSVANGVIMLRGATPLREPMVSAHIVINCPYSPNLSREYMLFIDPAVPAYEEAVVTQQTSVEATPVAVSNTPVAAPVATPAVAPPVRRAPVVKDLGPSSSYRVQSGDSVSEIAQRIENRNVGLWTAVDAIVAANPDAFVNNDPNRLRAGSTLLIPSFDGNAAVVAEVVAAEAATTETGVIETAVTEAAPVTTQDTTASATQDALVEETTADLKPGNVVDDENPYVADTAAGGVVIPDTALEGPQTSSSSPNVATATIVSSEAPNSTSGTPSWIFWLAGSGIALILGLLMFGRRFRGDDDTLTPVAADAQDYGRRMSDLERDSDTESLAAVRIDHDLSEELAETLSDDSPTEENLTLDADLVIGSGLTSGANTDNAQNFGFASTSEVDIELPFEPVAAASDETDILPPLRTDEFSILDSEVMPNEEDDYDMSVLIDATKMPLPDDVPEHDLKAVEVAAEDETAITSSYTIDEEVDYQVLEQDYEDELTATQALNMEIARAAAELSERMEGDADADSNDETSALPLASVTELDITAQMPAQNDDDSGPEFASLDDTSVTQKITLDKSEESEEPTVEMPMESGKAK